MPLSGKRAPILTATLVVAAFFAGSLYAKVQMLEKGSVLAGARNSINNRKSVATSQTQQPADGVASVDDDPILGDRNAPITMIEFSDYECPFCKRFADETLPQLKKQYIDTGKIKLVIRDLPLSFHDPMATKEGVAANCAREQGSDTKYFQYHDEIFARTKSNGNGLSEADLMTIATDIGLNLNWFNSCLVDPVQTEEVEKDLADAGKAGATGTPTFVIGKTTANGEVRGELVVGAQPFATFRAIIDPMLE